METTWDTLIRGGLVFDGTGTAPSEVDIAIKDGQVVAKGKDLPAQQAGEVISAEGQWVMPGLLDIHTHLDLEVDLDPRLPEAVRHGTTTVVVGNCSLGTCFGQQKQGNQNPIVDCFTRVENIPKKVLAKCVESITWDNTGDYMDHFDGMPLGPNIAAFVPHSMLRIEVMGLQASISRAPTETELNKMADILERALRQGYLGLSTDGLPFHYLANDPNTDKRIPTQFASFKEMKRLLKVVREHNKVWQTTPIIESRPKAFKYFALTSGRLFGGKPLKTSALAALSFELAPRAAQIFLRFAALMNSRLFNGKLHFQALGTNFRIWSDGVVSPLYEELGSTCQLIAKEYDDVQGRLELLNDPEFIAAFRADWHRGRIKGFNWPYIKTLLGIPGSTVVRDFNRMIFDGAPVAEWDGESFQQVFDRLGLFQNGNASQARSDAEREAFAQFPSPIGDDAEFMLHLMRTYDKSFRYYADVANTNKDATLELLLHRHTMPGFSDSGAHITNMAFFDSNLMSLKLAQQQGLDVVGRMVQRLTSEPAEFFGLPDVGSLQIGARADVVMIDPEALSRHECDETRELVHRDLFEHNQMVSRSDGVVSRVLIKGVEVWEGCEFAGVLGQQQLGEALRSP